MLFIDIKLINNYSGITEMSEVDLRTNCPFCRIDISDPEHDPANCLHESYTMLMRARERMDSLETRFHNIENRNEEEIHPAEMTQPSPPPPNSRLRNRYFRLKWKFQDMVRSWAWPLLISLALLRFILYGIN